MKKTKAQLEQEERDRDASERAIVKAFELFHIPKPTRKGGLGAVCCAIGTALLKVDASTEIAKTALLAITPPTVNGNVAWTTSALHAGQTYRAVREYLRCYLIWLDGETAKSADGERHDE